MPGAKYKVMAVGPQIAATATAPVFVSIAGVAKKVLPNQPFIVANELVCCNIARALLLPCPPGALMESGNDTYFFSLDFNLAGQALPRVSPAAIVQIFPDLCTFLFHLLVGGGALDAYRWNVDEDGNVTLAAEIATTLDRLQLLANERELFARHPVVRERPVSGHHVTHTPSFSQRNGRLYVFDHIDLQAYSLVRPSADNGSDAIDYAKKVLGSESSIVNWLDENARGAFLEERR